MASLDDHRLTRDSQPGGEPRLGAYLFDSEVVVARVYVYVLPIHTMDGGFPPSNRVFSIPRYAVLLYVCTRPFFRPQTTPHSEWQRPCIFHTFFAAPGEGGDILYETPKIYFTLCPCGGLPTFFAPPFDAVAAAGRRFPLSSLRCRSGSARPRGHASSRAFVRLLTCWHHESSR